MANYISEFTGAQIDNLLNSADNHFNISNIPNSSNLNDYITPGMYGTSSNANTQTITNRPPNIIGGFTLWVFPVGSGTVIGQMAFSNDDSAIFYRKRVSGTWGGWWALPLLNTAYNRVGTTEQRPILLNLDDGRKRYIQGFMYFDTTLEKPIFWIGDAVDGNSNPISATGWIDATGASV